jgi:vacuolar-type H+-ATPase subunit E/Vma4
MTAAAAATALAPTRARMMRDAADQAARILADARREADAITAQARQEAEQTVSLARTAGRAQAMPQAAAVRRQARSDARSAVLGARREAYDELRARVRAAVDGLRGEPGYDRLLEALTRMARLEAGPGATVTAYEDGGILARSPGVLVDCSLPRLADLAVEALDGEVRELWAP